MMSALIHDRGRGPELVGTRITVYNLLTHLLDPTLTEAQIGIVNDLTPEQVAAARAYVLSHADTVLAGHLRIEERIARETGAGDAEQALRAKQTFAKFKEWLAEREADERADETPANGNPGAHRLPPFREWLREQESRSNSAIRS